MDESVLAVQPPAVDELTVDEFIARFRKASVRDELPGEFLEVTVEEALRSGNWTARKMLTDGRFAK